MAFRGPQFTGPDFSPLERIPQLLQAAAAQRAAQARADRMAATQEAYSRAQTTRLAEQHRVNVAKEERQRRLDEMQAVDRAYGLAASGQPGRANLLAAASGFKLRQKPAAGPGPLPPAPVEPAPVPYGPAQDPAEAAAYAQQQAAAQMSPVDGPVEPRVREAGQQAATQAADYGANVQRYSQQFQAYRAEADQRPELEAQHAAAAQQAEANPAYEVELSDGSVHEFDPGEQKAAKRAEATERAQALREAAARSNDPKLQQSMLHAADVLESGVAGKDKDYLHKSQLQSSRQDHAVSLTQMKNDFAYRLAMLKGRRGAGGGKGKGKGGGKGSGAAYGDVDLLNEGRVDQLFRQSLDHKDYKREYARYSKYTSLAELISGDPNAARDAIAAGMFAKEAQGGVGVLSDNDYKVFWSKIGGVVARTDDALEQALSGRMGEDKRRLVLEAVKAVTANIESRLNETVESALGRVDFVDPAVQARLKKGYGAGGKKKPVATPAAAAANAASDHEAWADSMFGL